jgi:hypothetical protein
MPSFAIISEGITDFKILENILEGYFSENEEEVFVNEVPLSDDATSRGSALPPGGWTLVMRALRQGRHREALQNNDYVVVHIDTDVAEEAGYDVSRRDARGQVLSPEELIEKVRFRLIAEMGSESHAQCASRIIFAIAVDSIECWLLPLLYDGEAAKKAKITGCLNAADRKLERMNRPLLNKDPTNYERESRLYAKYRELMAHRGENPSLDVFVTNLATAVSGVVAATALSG